MKTPIETNYSAFFEAVKQWQRNEGNTCSVCHQSNMNMECPACHWWGKVAPAGFTPKTIAPKLKSFRAACSNIATV